MTVADFLLKGIFIGLVFGVPVGAIGMLTIKRTLSYGKLAGIVSGIGCSVADLFYACMSVFGFSLFSDFLLEHKSIIRLLGGFLVIVMGLNIIRKEQVNMKETISASKLMSFFISSFLIAATNPTTILTFLLAFSIFRVGEVRNTAQGVGLVVGIFIGTCIWWVFITTVLRALRHRITEKVLQIINRCLGGLILVKIVIVNFT